MLNSNEYPLKLIQLVFSKLLKVYVVFGSQHTQVYANHERFSHHFLDPKFSPVIEPCCPPFSDALLEPFLQTDVLVLSIHFKLSHFDSLSECLVV